MCSKRVLVAVLLSPLLVIRPVWSRQDSFVGHWEGSVASATEQQDVRLTILEDGGSLTGTIRSPRSSVVLEGIVVQEKDLRAVTRVGTHQDRLIVHYQFHLDGDTLTGRGVMNFNGQALHLDYLLKRTRPQAIGQRPDPTRRRRPRISTPQPRPKQSLKYFEGGWTFQSTARDSDLGPGGTTRGRVIYTQILDGRFLEATTTGETEENVFKRVSYWGFDPKTQLVTLFEQRFGDIPTLGLGNWSSALSIRFELEPLRLRGNRIELKKTIRFVARHSFTVVEEFSVNGGKYQRLGDSVYTRDRMNQSLP